LLVRDLHICRSGRTFCNLIAHAQTLTL
jgi:hypothetical protein